MSKNKVIIKEIINEKINLSYPRFNCDGDLGDDIPYPLPCQHFFMSFIGTAGSGKTKPCTRFIDYTGRRKVY